MNVRFLTVLALLPMIAGCVSAPMPIPTGYSGPRAKVTDTSTSVSSTKIYFFQLAKVDGRTVKTSSALHLSSESRTRFRHGSKAHPGGTGRPMRIGH